MLNNESETQNNFVGMEWLLSVLVVYLCDCVSVNYGSLPRVMREGCPVYHQTRKKPKFKIQSAISTEYVLFSHHHQVKTS